MRFFAAGAFFLPGPRAREEERPIRLLPGRPRAAVGAPEPMSSLPQETLPGCNPTLHLERRLENSVRGCSPICLNRDDEEKQKRTRRPSSCRGGACRDPTLERRRSVNGFVTSFLLFFVALATGCVRAKRPSEKGVRARLMRNDPSLAQPSPTVTYPYHTRGRGSFDHFKKGAASARASCVVPNLAVSVQIS